MSFEEARVITIVYLAVFLPFLIYFKNKSNLPKWIPTFYLIAKAFETATLLFFH